MFKPCNNKNNNSTPEPARPVDQLLFVDCVHCKSCDRLLQHTTVEMDEVPPMDENDESLKASNEDMGDLEETGDDGKRDGEPKDQFSCPSCGARYQQPRVLHCLHVLCTPCLEKLLAPTEDEGKTVGQRLGDSRVMICPVCKQETHVGAIGELPLDVVMMNMMDMDDIREMRMLCTSCKAQENAVARCSDCASFLCPNCVTAHKYMRCFENHKVTHILFLHYQHLY